MSAVVLLDAGPLGMYASAGGRPKNGICKARINALLAAGKIVTVPGIADYEVRRELTLLTLQQPACKAIPRLDMVIHVLGRIPVADETTVLASRIWAHCRKHGIVTAPKEALDGDVLLVAHALIERAKGNVVEVATTNSADLSSVVASFAPNQVAVLNWDDLK